METKAKSELSLKIWLMILELDHKMLWVRQKELSQYAISTRQHQIMQVIDHLGSKAILSRIAKVTQRQLAVISRQVVIMENEGLIRRIKDRPKSRLLRLELTERGAELLKSIQYSKGMDEVLSVLTEERMRELYSILNQVTLKMNKYALAQIDPEES